ncbi:MAG: glycosyltransferase family 2 protein [Solirubrobacterales bacterium]|nr:glycosyltransferase family 2 protein [Solirubrobacterales bacterium]MCO5327236.1 glycosyltransferase family 2 protein [Solirubrobacterales bacterium]
MSEDADSPEAPAAGAPRLSVVIVGYESADALSRSLPPLLDELRPGDELIVCDNGSTDGTAATVAEFAPAARLIEAGANLGFAAGCNRAAAEATGDLLLLLNPDNVVAPGFRDAIELPLIEGRGWGAWQGLVTDGGGAILNTTGGVVHFTGIAWAGDAGRPRAAAPAAPREVPYPSGACLAIRRELWNELGGFSEPYFLYHEDTDLGLRVRLAGHATGIEPRALCDHDYEFDKGAAKWRYLERNRWATVIRDYPGRLLAAVMPALLVTELALLLVAALGGWLPQKLGAWVDTARALPRLLRERREIQATRAVDVATFAGAALTADLDSEYLGRAGDSRLLGMLLRAYWRAATRLL